MNTVWKTLTSSVNLRRLWWIAAGVGIVLLVFTRVLGNNEADVLWQARSGLDILNGSAGLSGSPDLWGWNSQSWNWVPNSVGWNLTLGEFYNIAGLWGLAVVAALVSCATVLWLLLWTRQASRSYQVPVSAQAVCISLSALLITGAVTMQPRPAAPATLLFLFSLPLLDRLVRQRTSTGSYWLLAVSWAVVAVLGMWVHQSWVLLGLLGPVYLLASAAGRSPWRGVGPFLRLWAIPTVAVTGAYIVALITGPLGLSGVTHALFVKDASTGMITEWLTLWQLVGDPTFIAFLAMAAVAFIAVLLTARQKRTWGLWAVTLLLLSGGVLTVRLLPWAALLGTALLVVRASRRRAERNGRSDVLNSVTDTLTLLAAITLLVGLAGVTITSLASGAAFNNRITSAQALPDSCHLFSDPESAGAVILTRPDVKVYVDGRNDYWGRQRYEQTIGVLNADPAGVAWLNASPANCVLLSTRVEWPLEMALAADPNWVEVTDSGYSTLFIRAHD